VLFSIWALALVGVVTVAAVVRAARRERRALTQGLLSFEIDGRAVTLLAVQSDAGLPTRQWRARTPLPESWPSLAEHCNFRGLDLRGPPEVAGQELEVVMGRGLSTEGQAREVAKALARVLDEAQRSLSGSGAADAEGPGSGAPVGIPAVTDE
jgi:hypothetical protein